MLAFSPRTGTAVKQMWSVETSVDLPMETYRLKVAFVLQPVIFICNDRERALTQRGFASFKMICGLFYHCTCARNVFFKSQRPLSCMFFYTFNPCFSCSMHTSFLFSLTSVNLNLSTSFGPPLMWCRGAVSHVCLNECVSIVMFPNGVVQINSLFS